MTWGALQWQYLNTGIDFAPFPRARTLSDLMRLPRFNRKNEGGTCLSEIDLPFDGVNRRDAKLKPWWLGDIWHRVIVVVVITVGCVFATVGLMYAVFAYMHEPIRPAAKLVSVLAPGLLAPLVTWYLMSLLGKVDALRRQAYQLATFDGLTGLLVRRAFLEQANLYLDLLRRQGGRFAVLMIDIDNFKGINDTYGHAGGDYVLTKFSEFICRHKRQTDLVGRFGGEEFVFLLWGTSPEGAQAYAQTLLSGIAEVPLEFDGKMFRCTVSISLCHHASDGAPESLDSIIGRADKALYGAKSAGRNRIMADPALPGGRPLSESACPVGPQARA